jgi:predicted nuclease of predicted toxin-antitoxin system
MRWLLDQGLPQSATGLLNQSGHDAVHVGHFGMAKASDAEILNLGREAYRVVVTLDADFHSLLAHSREGKPSVVRIREEGLKAPELSEILDRIGKRFEAELTEGCLLTYLKGKVRIRKIPFSD